jgi:antitoxin component HigA of HigAB toxin-antitoxin module
MLTQIIANADYEAVMRIIEMYLTKGSVNLTEPDLAELQRLSRLVDTYEDRHYPMPVHAS